MLLCWWDCVCGLLFGAQEFFLEIDVVVVDIEQVDVYVGVLLFQQVYGGVFCVVEVDYLSVFWQGQFVLECGDLVVGVEDFLVVFNCVDLVFFFVVYEDVVFCVVEVVVVIQFGGLDMVVCGIVEDFQCVVYGMMQGRQ